MNTLIQDTRYAIRTLLRSPAFAAIAILTLALGIGANTALFSVVNGVLLDPLPYPDPGRLVALYGKAPGADHSPISYPNFLDWQRDTRSFSSIALYHNEDYNFTGAGEAERVSGYMISASFFHTLGVRPMLGRGFRTDEDVVGAAPVVVLGAGLWHRRFGGSPSVIGSSIDLNGTAYTVIGVMSPDFTFYGHDRDVYTPIGQWNDPTFLDRNAVFSSGMVGRLAPGVTLAQATADLQNVAAHLAEEYPEADKGVGATAVALQDDQVGSVQPVLLVLLGAVAFLLLIACANVANLLLARSTARSREFAIRVALGASHGQVVRQLLTESVLLAGAGGALGLLFATWSKRAVLGALPAALPHTRALSLDTRVLVFTIGISLFAGIVFGLAPALKASRINLQDVLKEGGRGSSGVRHRLQRVFVAAQVAMALVLLVGAGLMMRSLAALWHVDPGFDASHAVTFSLSMPASYSTASADTRARLRAFDAKMLTLPGVDAVSATLGSRPMVHNSTEAFWVEGRPKPANLNDMNQALFYLAEDGFQRAMGVRLERGRFITPQDDEHAPTVIVIDSVFAHTYFPNEDPIGKRIHLATFGAEAEVVGVVDHVRQWGLDTDASSAIEAQFYFPFMQLPDKIMRLAATGVAVVLRTRGDPAAVMGPVRQAVAQIDPRDVIYNASTMRDVLANSLAARRFLMVLLGVFAALALALACVGIYGVIAYLVGQRTNEIGVRMALGAQRVDVLRLVVGEGARMAMVGAAVGILAALAVTRLMAHQLFGVSAHDPLTFAGVALLLMLVAILACYLPARRATRVDPVVALRNE
ncbi:MAG TPA: ABC transporter permease [Gemmatimonadaceae bacterium]|jgi:predicted permease